MGAMAETNGDVTIEDIDANTFEQFLWNASIMFMYCDKTDLDGDNVLKCLFAAKKYCLDDLVVCCKVFLENSISTDNVCTIYEQAKFFGEPDLQEKCRIFVLENTSDIFKGHDVVNLSKETLSSFLNDDLPTTELQYFQAVWRWSDEECRKRDIEATPENKRNVLDGILEKIRFPLMTLNEFAEHVTPSKILSYQEIAELFQFLVARKTRTPGHVAQYISLPRKAFSTGIALDLSHAVWSQFDTMKKFNLYTVVLESSHAININTLTCGRKHTFKSIVVTKTYGGDELTRIPLLGESAYTCNDESNEFKINSKVTVPEKTKSMVVFEVEPLKKTRNVIRNYEYESETYTEDIPIIHKRISLKYEQGEISIDVTEIPVELTGIRYTLCLDNAGIEATS